MALESAYDIIGKQITNSKIDITWKINQLICSLCFTRRQFEDFVLGPLFLYFGKDDKGNKQKPKLGAFDGYSYDKMYKDAEKLISTFPTNDIVKKSDVDKLISILKKYKGKKSPKKLELPKMIIMLLGNLKEYIDYINEWIKWKENDWKKCGTSKESPERNIVCFSQTLVIIDYIPKVKKALKEAAKALNSLGEEKIKKQSGQWLIKYYLN